MNNEYEFRYDVGFYCDNPKYDNILAWHGCSNKVLQFSRDAFSKLQAGRNICPNCGVSVILWDEWAFNEPSESEEPEELGECKIVADKKRHVIFRFSTISLVKITVTDFKISIGIFRSDYNLWNASSVFAKSTYYKRITMNIKTGYSYEFAEVTLGKKKSWNQYRRPLANISYCGSYVVLPQDVLTFLKDIVYQKTLSLHGEEVYPIDICLHDLTLSNIIFYIRTPFILPSLYNDIIKRSRRFAYDPIRLKELLVKNDCTDPIQQIFLQSKIPDVKSLRKLAFTESYAIPLLASISRTFKNVDIIRSLYYAYKTCWSIMYSRDDFGCYIDFSAKVFKVMVKFKGEKVISEKLLNFIKSDSLDINIFRTLNDIIRCYDELGTCSFDFSGKYTIDELHLCLAKMVSDKNNENIEIEYDKTACQLELSNDTYKLSLAKDTHELVDVGEKMDICVGSYANKAIRNKSIILVLRCLEALNPLGCIELRKNNVVQVKGFNNTLLKNNELEFVHNWVKEKSLLVCTNDLA